MLMLIRNILGKGAFRVNDWWRSKAALLMGMVYLFTAWFQLAFLDFVWMGLLSVMTITGFASFGYLVNDLFDMEQDLKAGKKNSLAGKPAIFIVLFFAISAALIFVPWIWLPATGFSYFLIALQLSLFLIYSVPFIRLKEKGLAGIVTDALYAHAVPPILAAYTFSLAAHSSLSDSGLLLLFAWQFTSGVRNILIHQQTDIDADRRSGSKNFVAGMSRSGFLFSLKYLIVLELLLCSLFFAALSAINPYFLLAVAAVAGLSSYVLVIFRRSGTSAFYDSDWRFFPNNVFEKWMPAVYLLILSIVDLRFALVFLLHTLLYNFDLYVTIADRCFIIWKAIPFRKIFYQPVRDILSWIVNHLIYFVFLLGGVNLKKENTSALGYLKKRQGKI
jgi:4-hydroxybenzoate polyprenyltransferase